MFLIDIHFGRPFAWSSFWRTKIENMDILIWEIPRIPSRNFTRENPSSWNRSFKLWIEEESHVSIYLYNIHI